jgi:hypothetical protein
MSKKQVYIEVWQNGDDKGHWIATAQGDLPMKPTSEYPLSWFAKDGWYSWYKIDGKSYCIIVCSRDVFSRQECIAIAALIISGKGLKQWEIELE